MKHNPWPYFARERALCRTHDLPVSALGAAVDAGALPNAAMVVPDLCHDAHDCSLATADRWFRQWMTRIQAGPDWTSGRLAVVLTADEDDSSAGNRVLTVVAHPSQRHRVVTARLDHYSCREAQPVALLRPGAGAVPHARPAGLGAGSGGRRGRAAECRDGRPSVGSTLR